VGIKGLEAQLKAAQVASEKLTEEKRRTHCKDQEKLIKGLEAQLETAQENPEDLADEKQEQINLLDQKSKQEED
jgi:hypothetical protein